MDQEVYNRIVKQGLQKPQIYISPNTCQICLFFKLSKNGICPFCSQKPRRDVLQRAFQNTVTMIKQNVEVE